jgi:hypothetical protein
MNFLLHHHLASRDLASPAAGAGAMLPDLWRIADKRVRAMHADFGASNEEATGALREVLDGIAHHVEVDRWFHADPVFVEGERAAIAMIRAAAIGAPRMPLFAHILWELCLDGALVASRGDAIVDDVRAGFEAASREGAGDRAATLHHFARVERTAEERALFDQRMRRIEEELARGPWIRGYANGAGIAERIDGVRARVGFARMDVQDRDRLALVADELLARADSALAAFL